MFIYPSNSVNIMTFLLLFAIVAGLFLVIMLAFTILRFIQQSQSPPNSRLNSRHLSQLQTSRFCKGGQYETCAICLEDYKDKDKLRILPCSHGYHTKCIDPWLTNNRCICPVCKQSVVLAGKYPHATSDLGRRTETTPLLTSHSSVFAPHGTFMSENEHASVIPDNNLTTEHSNDQNLNSRLN